MLLVAGQLETAVNAALRGERGYLITGDPDFLTPYLRRTRATAIVHLRRLAGAHPDNRSSSAFWSRSDNGSIPISAIIDRLVPLEKPPPRRNHRHRPQLLGHRQIEDFLGRCARVAAENAAARPCAALASSAADARNDRYNYIIAAVAALLMALLRSIAILGAARAHRRALDAHRGVAAALNA